MYSSQFGRNLALIAHLQKLTCTGILWYSIARMISMVLHVRTILYTVQSHTYRMYMVHERLTACFV